MPRLKLVKVESPHSTPELRLFRYIEVAPDTARKLMRPRRHRPREAGR